MAMTQTPVSTLSVVAPAAEYDIVIIGAGFSGVYQLHRYRQLGFSVRLIDAGGDLGGIWYWNCYPGARVDTHVPIYEFSDENLWKDWNWSQRFPGWEELRRYFDYVDSKWDIRKDCQFNSWVTSSTFDETDNKWTLRVNHESALRARFVIMATGSSSPPYTPKIEGLASFAGIQSHTALWPQGGIDFTGQRVAVIGCGASGVQVIQEAAKTAKHLTVFQRTPNTSLPMDQAQLDVATQTAMKAGYPALFEKRRGTFAGFDFDLIMSPGAALSKEERDKTWDQLWSEGGFSFWLGNYYDIFSDKDLNLAAYQYWRDKVRARVNDPKVAELLAPTDPVHPFGTKRCSLENGYYDVFNQDNVTLVDMRTTPIQRITPTGAVTSDGLAHAFDILVLATGFDAVSGAILHMDITGAGGARIQDYWKDGLKTQLGLASAGFPNFFFLYGPQSPTAFWNGPSSAEQQGEVLVQLLKHLRDQGYTRCESTPQADADWAQLVDDIVQQSLIPLADSWYMGANIPGKKRESLNFTGGVPLYLQKCQESADKGYAGFTMS